jgi:orotidine-5'-phosphate decarboxylase
MSFVRKFAVTTTMNRTELTRQIQKKGSFLCVGLDPDPVKFPEKWKNDRSAVTQFCHAIIDSTSPYAVAYKLNIAFFEALGRKGWEILAEVRALLPEDCFLIADAKRADIGNSSRMYARAFFDELDFDAVTVAPYMGADSVIPFLEYENKWTILLALTSNDGASDFQTIPDQNGVMLFERVLRTAMTWGSPQNLMFVVGGTQVSQLELVREIAPEHFLLVPGIGAQGGDLDTVANICLNAHGGILVNSSREILYASKGADFADAAQQKCISYQNAMKGLLSKAGL